MSQNPLFLPKIVSQSPLFFPHCLKFWKFFTQSPKIGWNLIKKVMPPIFMAFVTERPLFLALHAHVWEECCSLKHRLQKLENFVFLKQNRAIWWILLGANLIKVMKQNFRSTGSTDPFVHYGWTSLAAGLKHERGYILQPPSVWLCATWLSKQMPSVPEAVQAEAC